MLRGTCALPPDAIDLRDLSREPRDQRTVHLPPLSRTILTLWIWPKRSKAPVNSSSCVIGKQKSLVLSRKCCELAASHGELSLRGLSPQLPCHRPRRCGSWADGPPLQLVLCPHQVRCLHSLHLGPKPDWWSSSSKSACALACTWYFGASTWSMSSFGGLCTAMP